MFGLFKSDQSAQKIELTVSSKTVVQVLLLVIISLLFLSALTKAASAIILIASGVFLATVLNAPVHLLASRLPGKVRGNRTIATTISFVLIIGLLLGFLASIVPPLLTQTGNFIEALPRLVSDMREGNNVLGEFVRNNGLESQIDKLSSQLSERSDDLAGSAFDAAAAVGSSIFATITILVVAFMMLIESPRWINFFKSFIPKKKQARSERLIGDMYGVIKGYVNGQVLLAALAACIIVVPLFVLDIRYPIALMVVVFVCGLIPMIGHFIGATVVTLVALFTSLSSALFILAFYILYQQIENYAVQPRIQASTTNMTPLMVFVSVIIGVSFGGLFGGLVAIPIAGCLKVLLEDYLEHFRKAESKN